MTTADADLDELAEVAHRAARIETDVPERATTELDDRSGPDVEDRSAPGESLVDAMPELLGGSTS